MKRLINKIFQKKGEVIINGSLSVHDDGDVEVGKNLHVDGVINSEYNHYAIMELEDDAVPEVTYNVVVEKDGLVMISLTGTFTLDLGSTLVASLPLAFAPNESVFTSLYSYDTDNANPIAKVWIDSYGNVNVVTSSSLNVTASFRVCYFIG